MDLFRRNAEGRLSALIGTLTLPTDVRMRTIFTARDGQRLEEALWARTQRDAPEIARFLEAFAAGVRRITACGAAALGTGASGGPTPIGAGLGVETRRSQKGARRVAARPPRAARSLLSRTAPPGNPTIAKFGSPPATSTSTSTRCAAMPASTQEKARAVT
jgi:hypothetical protein